MAKFPSKHQDANADRQRNAGVTSVVCQRLVNWNTEEPNTNMSHNPKGDPQITVFETIRLADCFSQNFAPHLPATRTTGQIMKKLLSAGVLILLLTCCFGAMAQTSIPGGIAVSIVYDGSGSMGDRVTGADNIQTPKFLIANKAIGSIIRQLAAFSQEKHVNVQAGLVYFVDGKIHQGIPLTTLTATNGALFTDWARGFRAPAGGTPLGLAIQEAGAQLAGSPNLHKHILVITDGESNAGITPDQAVHKLRTSTNPIPVYFVAFDVSASVFSKAKSEGATVVSASNESQLNTQINSILGQKILLEAE